jgi:hypothetical protein
LVSMGGRSSSPHGIGFVLETRLRVNYSSAPHQNGFVGTKAHGQSPPDT